MRGDLSTKALEAGARGFVSKNAVPEEFLEAVDAILAGGNRHRKERAA